MNVHVVFLILPFILFADLSWGHGEVVPRIRNASREIAKEPTNASRYRHRGNLYRKYKDWKAALDDFQQAARMQPNLSGVDRQIAEMHFKLKDYEAAEQALALFLQAHPNDLQARRLNANLLAAQGQVDAADAAFDRILKTLPHPTVDFYVEWIDAIASNGPEQYPRALQRIHIALDRLGPIPSLQLKALRLEEERGNYDTALGWLERLIAQSAHPETWLVRKGEILKAAGRNDQAVAVYRQALTAWERRPAWARETAEARQLLQRISKELP